MEGSSGSAGQPSGTARPVFEYKLRSIASTNYIHNVMTLAGPPVNLADFTTPIRLIRDPSSRGEGGEGSMLGRGSDDEEKQDPSTLRRKRKTRLIQPEEDEENSALKAQEKAPWLLEDFDGQHSYVSQLLTPDAKYVIFVNQGNEFRVLLASKWYKFSPKLTYRPLTLEEAEERMASKGKNEDYDRWLMRKRTAALASAGESSGSSSVAGESASAVPKAGPVVSTRFVNLEEEGFDYQEFVDDDDGEDLYNHRGNPDEDDPSMPRIERARPTKNLTDAGRQYKKIVKHLDRANYLYDSEEEVDPYADDDDLPVASDDEEAKKPLAPPPPARLQVAPKLAIQSQRSVESLASARPRQPISRSRSKSPSGSSSRQRSKSPQQSSRQLSPTNSGAASPPRSPIEPSSSEGASLTEHDIVSVLREAPLSTKDLISRVKHKLKADPRNKDIFRDIVRRVASIRTSPSQDKDDKLLELKPEYR